MPGENNHQQDLELIARTTMISGPRIPVEWILSPDKDKLEIFQLIKKQQWTADRIVRRIIAFMNDIWLHVERYQNEYEESQNDIRKIASALGMDIKEPEDKINCMLVHSPSARVDVSKIVSKIHDLIEEKK